MAAYKQILGTNENDTAILTTSAGQQEVVLALGGDDIITADFQSADYIIGGDGQDTLATNLSYSSFSIKKHPFIDEAYLVTYTAADGKSTINIVKGIESFQFTEGKIAIADFLAALPIDGQTEGQTVVLDGKGAIDIYVTLDASGGNFLYKNDLTASNFVDIKNFTNGDQVSIVGKADQISITNDGVDVIITNNIAIVTGTVVITSITLLGVVSADSIISDETTLEQAMGFNALNIINI